MVSAVDEEMAWLSRGFQEGLSLVRQVLEARPDAAPSVSVSGCSSTVTASVNVVSLCMDIGRYGATCAWVSRNDKPKDFPQTSTDFGAAIAAWVASIEEIESMP